MKPSDAKHLAQRLVELFPGQLKQAEKFEAQRRFSEMDRPIVDRVIGEAWEQFKKYGTRLTLTELFDTCKKSQFEFKASPVNVELTEGSPADIYRRTDPQFRDVKSDIEVIIRKYRKDWYACRYQESYRAGFRRQCAASLMAGGMELSQPIAEQWADTIFADPEHFRTVLEDLRGNTPLAKAG